MMQPLSGHLRRTCAAGARRRGSRAAAPGRARAAARPAPAPPRPHRRPRRPPRPGRTPPIPRSAARTRSPPCWPDVPPPCGPTTGRASSPPWTTRPRVSGCVSSRCSTPSRKLPLARLLLRHAAARAGPGRRPGRRARTAGLGVPGGRQLPARRVRHRARASSSRTSPWCTAAAGGSWPTTATAAPSPSSGTSPTSPSCAAAPHWSSAPDPPARLRPYLALGDTAVPRVSRVWGARGTPTSCSSSRGRRPDGRAAQPGPGQRRAGGRRDRRAVRRDRAGRRRPHLRQPPRLRRPAAPRTAGRGDTRVHPRGHPLDDRPAGAAVAVRGDGRLRRATATPAPAASRSPPPCCSASAPATGPRPCPSAADFDPSRSTIAPSYNAAWLAVNRIVDRFGLPALVRFYRTAATSPDPSAPAGDRRGEHRRGLRVGAARLRGLLHRRTGWPICGLGRIVRDSTTSAPTSQNWL